MMKECVLHNGKVINIGPWDYRIQPVQVGVEEVILESEREIDGEIIPAVIEYRPIYEDQITNPIPEGSVIEQKEVEQDADDGWYVIGEIKLPNELDIIGQQLVNRELEVLGLRSENELLGSQLVSIDIRLLEGGL
ncbi:hypothetical protein OB236_38295 [Paenibacillus sp. WQ 127069]|uniref:Uncharacterized protein n=1 Tax=Paenibacillus baimaensis TaxID=2982185 RepID=A0ABT2UTX0_9BACL|nr:hypothetical protein [Paenibacillus sp. WQ 127069]MCU6797992.1 hypothetical protein [Paenibacillus sp. WQ 127069]